MRAGLLAGPASLLPSRDRAERIFACIDPVLAAFLAHLVYLLATQEPVCLSRGRCATPRRHRRQGRCAQAGPVSASHRDLSLPIAAHTTTLVGGRRPLLIASRGLVVL